MEFKKYTAVLLFLVGILIANAQPFAIGFRAENFVDVARNNRTIATDVYYPALENGTNANFAQTTNGFPVIVFGHGFVMTVDAYQNFVDVLVPLGYVVVLPKTEGTFSPSHQQFGLDLAFLIQHMAALNAEANNFYHNKLHPKSVLMGHSMGGGAATLAAQSFQNNVVLATFAPAETNPSAISAASQISIPSIVFAGANDCVTPPQTHQMPIYNALNSSCKQYISIIGGSHCQMANSNLFCNIGENSCTPTPSISRQTQHQHLFSLLLPWLRFHLFEDCTAGAQFDALAENTTQWLVNTDCQLCTLINVPHPNQGWTFEFFPNPNTGEIVVKPQPNEVLNIRIYDPNGKIIFAKIIEQQILIQLPQTAGFYVLHATNQSQSATYKLLRK